LAYCSYYLGRKTSIGNASALHFLHVDLQVLDQGEVNVGLCDGGQEWVAGDRKRPLVDLENEVLGAKFSGVAVRSFHFVSGGGKFENEVSLGFLLSNTVFLTFGSFLGF